MLPEKDAMRVLAGVRRTGSEPKVPLSSSSGLVLLLGLTEGRHITGATLPPARSSLIRWIVNQGDKLTYDKYRNGDSVKRNAIVTENGKGDLSGSSRSITLELGAAPSS